MLKRTSFMLCLSVVFLAGLSKLMVANAMEDHKGVVATTMCCNGGRQTGNSNDCISGTGSCTDHSCADGEGESANGCSGHP
jgi:hypothetical protein